MLYRPSYKPGIQDEYLVRLKYLFVGQWHYLFLSFSPHVKNAIVIFCLLPFQEG